MTFVHYTNKSKISTTTEYSEFYSKHKITLQRTIQFYTRL